MQKIIMHVDFDYFFAQCEEIRNPKIKDKPVIVCVFSNRGNDSGVVATSNYIARRYKIKSGISITLAKMKLGSRNDAIFIKPDYQYYSKISDSAMHIIKKYANIFEYVGKDEAYLDISKNCNSNYENAKSISNKMKDEILNKIRMTCSIGMSHNKLISKIASAHEKPNGLTIVRPENVSKFLNNIEISKIPRIGSKTMKRITEMNLYTIKQLQELDIFKINQLFGKKFGSYIYNSIRGRCSEVVKIKEPVNQISKIITLQNDLNEYKYILQNLLYICKSIHKIVVAEKKMFKNVTIQLVRTNLVSKTASKMLLRHTNNKSEFENVIKNLLIGMLDKNDKIRRVGIRVSGLSSNVDQSNINTFF